MVVTRTVPPASPVQRVLLADGGCGGRQGEAGDKDAGGGAHTGRSEGLGRKRVRRRRSVAGGSAAGFDVWESRLERSMDAGRTASEGGNRYVGRQDVNLAASSMPFRCCARGVHRFGTAERSERRTTAPGHQHLLACAGLPAAEHTRGTQILHFRPIRTPLTARRLREAHARSPPQPHRADPRSNATQALSSPLMLFASGPAAEYTAGPLGCCPVGRCPHGGPTSLDERQDWCEVKGSWRGRGA